MGPIPPEVAPERARGLAHRILAEPQFAHQGQTWSATALRWLLRLFDRTVGTLLSAGGTSAGGWILVAVVVAVAAIVVARFGRGVRRDPAVAVEAEAASGRSGTDWAAAAAAHAAAGEWRDALRCRYAALVAGLGERGVLDEVPGRTTREYGGLVAANLPAAAADFDGASDLFEAAWYGNRSTGPADDDRLEALRRRVLAEAGAR